jgi:hypothetical protein
MGNDDARYQYRGFHRHASPQRCDNPGGFCDN